MAVIIVNRIMQTVIGIIEFLLVVRFVLELFRASEAAPFVAWLYSSTGGLIAPFAGAFPSMYIAGVFVDVSVVLALIGYAIIGWLLTMLLTLVLAPLTYL